MTPSALLLGALMAVVAMAACAGVQPRSEVEGDDGGIVAALCEARDEVVRDAAEAGAIFLDRAHDGLHELARAVEEIDRPTAARLLEAKQAVEAGLEPQSSSASLAEDLEALIASARRALEVTDRPGRGCVQGGTDG